MIYFLSNGIVSWQSAK
jgi:hypothetical protein